jgi:protein SCO1/2
MTLRHFCTCLGLLSLLLGSNLRATGQPAGENAARAEPAEATYRGGIVTPPIPKPSLTLTDTSGALFDLRSETRGYVTLLFFGYTHCPQECPLHMANIAMALKDLPADEVSLIRVVFVTTDPARDTGAVLRSWLDRFDNRFVGLTGTETAVRRAQIAAAIPLATKTVLSNGNYEIGHAGFVLAYSQDNLAHLIYPGGITVDDWVHDLSRLVHEHWLHH